MKEVLLATIKTIESKQPAVETAAKKTPAAAASFGDFFAAWELPPWEWVLRGVRVAAIFFGLLFLSTLLSGACQYIIASGRDNTVTECRRKIFVGAVGVLVMIFIYIFATLNLTELLGGE